MKLAVYLLSFFNSLIYINHLLLAFQSPTTALHPSNETDALTLLAIKNRIVEDPLGVFTSWNVSNHICSWKGVTCSNQHNGRVTMLNLVGQNLVGSIPPHIGNLSFLRHFNLSYNNFKGEVPEEIGRLLHLTHLDLSYNAFQGKIPCNLSSCSNLEDINFTNNNLTGDIPTELRNLSKSLHRFEVSANQFTGSIPQWLGNASSLTSLALGGNNLHGGIPRELGRLPKLLFLQLSENKLSGEVPLSIFNLSSLYFLAVAVNRLQGEIPSNIGFTLPNLRYLHAGANYFYGEIPSSLINVTKLEICDIGFNGLSGVVPSNLGTLRNLTVLSLADNQLENIEDEGLGFLTSLTNCSNLRWLLLHDNHFRGVLPTPIANLSTKLEKLWIAGNQISSKIPKEIGNLVGLTSLDMCSNSIIGEIPHSIAKLKNLSQLYLCENKFSGPFPSSLGNMSQLQKLSLFENNLSGPIPPNLGNCSQLEYIDLEKNSFFGNLPKQLFSFSRVIEVHLSRNSFTGQLPLDLVECKMINLVKLGVSYNQLSGGIPSALGSCLMLEQLWMNDNLFEGGIPPSFRALKSLVYFDVSSNNLSGQIPKYLQNFTFLQSLNLSFNNFEGELPTGGIFENASVISVAGNQRLCGGIHQLGLPSCEIKGRKKKGKLHRLTMLISICTSCLIFLIALLVIFSYKRRYKRKASTSIMVQELELEQFPKISFGELSQATNEFSSSNLIGEGSFGSVYKGILSQDAMLVAVKVLNLMRKGAFKSFMTECEALRNIRHRNLIKIITVCSSIDFKGDDFKALVYEFMQNGSLEEWLHQDKGQVGVRSLSLAQRLNIAIEVASAIEYLHNHCQPPIVHGDLKPSNVLLDEDMVAHVADFGLARFLLISQNQSNSVGVQGTIGYVAPEYGMSCMVSKHGDVYSFGILLLEMITGKRPTDPLFKDNFTIHHFTKIRLPEKAIEILEPSLLREVQDEENSTKWYMEERLGALESVVEIARVGLLCSMESSSERMDIKEVVAELLAIRDKFLCNKTKFSSA
ncbi:hypothetical protein SLA2020_239640 [Shorea laevis]